MAITEVRSLISNRVGSEGSSTPTTPALRSALGSSTMVAIAGWAKEVSVEEIKAMARVSPMTRALRLCKALPPFFQGFDGLGIGL
jgi:hypothetical protein